MIELYNMDCMDYMAGLPDKAFDLAICDPPYSDEINGLNVGVNRDFKYEHFKKPSKQYINEVFRVSENQIMFGFNHYMDLLPPTESFIFWNKHQNGHFSEGELAWCSCGKARYFDRAYQLDIGNKIHPTQKPIKLYAWLLKNYAKDGDKILDTHLGSGSSAIAAHKLGFDFVGCEIDKEYFEAAMKRYKKETAMPLFDQ